jgi:hypothetical protein
MYQNSISWFLTSNPAFGAQTDSTGSNFTVQLQEPFIIPSNASNITVELQQAIVWNSLVNVITGVNDTLHYKVNGVPTFVTLPQGVYDLHTLANYTMRLMTIAVPPLPADSFDVYLRGAYAIVSILVQSGAYITEINMGVPGDMSALLGFKPQDLIFTGSPVIGTQQTFQSDIAPPIKDGTKQLLLSSTLVNNGVRVNDKFSSVLAKISFGNTAPGSQLVFNPPSPSLVPADAGAGRSITQVQSFLTDAATGQAVTTNGEFWSYVAIMRYDTPLYEEPSKKRKTQ